MTKKQRLVIKTELAGKELFEILQNAVLYKHKKNKHVDRLLKKGQAEVVTRTELMMRSNPPKLSDLTILIEIYEEE